VGEYLKDLDIKDIDCIVLLEDSKNLQEESFIIEIAMIKEKIKKEQNHGKCQASNCRKSSSPL
jgi:hypothetical protein